MWLAGGGFKGGMTYGQTDEFGHRRPVNPVSPNDYQATLLHLFGLDHERLTYFSNGQAHTLTDGAQVPGGERNPQARVSR